MNSEHASRPPSPMDRKKEADQSRIIGLLRKRATDASGKGCFLCRLIVEDFDQNGKLTDHPKDAMGKGLFPYNGKTTHIRLELASGS